METLTANIVGKVRKETLYGRPFLVAPLSMIVPGVLAGSKGALYYPPDEVARNADAWDGMPLVLNHPVVNGRHVSGRQPAVLDRHGMGFVFGSGFNGKLLAEGWFDVGQTRRVDARVLDRLERGEPIELSTGLYTVNEPAPDGATHNGTPYSFVARSYRPDHLAVLLDARGACSLQDGCGVLANEALTVNPAWVRDEDVWEKAKAAVKRGDYETEEAYWAACAKVYKQMGGRMMSANTAGEPNVKDQLVNYLVTNCACWKGKTDVLANFSEEELQRFKAAAEQARSLEAIADAARERYRALHGGELATNALADWLRKDPTPAPKPPEPTPTPAPTPAPAPSPKPATMQDWLAMAPTEAKAVWNNAVSALNREKEDLVNRLTANVADAGARDRKRAIYARMDIEDLRLLAPEQEQLAGNGMLLPNYSFAGGGVPATPARDDSANLLPILDPFGDDGAAKKSA